MAITRSAIDHQENAKKRKDPMVKSHYSMHFLLEREQTLGEHLGKKQGALKDALNRLADRSLLPTDSIRTTAFSPAHSAPPEAVQPSANYL